VLQSNRQTQPTSHKRPAVNDEFMKQIIAELKHELLDAQGVALGLVTTAIARQLDATRLTQDLEQCIAAAEKLGRLSPTGKLLAIRALSAAEAESLYQSREKH